MTDTDKLKRLAEAAAEYQRSNPNMTIACAGYAGEFFALDHSEAILALIAENERLEERVVELEEGLLNMKIVGDAILSGMAPWQSAAILHGEYFSRIDAKGSE